MLTYHLVNDTNQDAAYKLFGEAVVDSHLPIINFWEDWNIPNFSPIEPVFINQIGTARTSQSVKDGNELQFEFEIEFGATGLTTIGIATGLVSNPADYLFAMEFDFDNNLLHIWEKGILVYTTFYDFDVFISFTYYFSIYIDSLSNELTYYDINNVFTIYTSSNTFDFSAGNNYFVVLSDGNCSIVNINLMLGFILPNKNKIEKNKIISDSKAIGAVGNGLSLESFQVRGSQGLANLPKIEKIKVDVFGNKKVTTYFPQDNYSNNSMINGVAFWDIPLAPNEYLGANQYWQVTVYPHTDCFLIFKVNLNRYYKEEEKLIADMWKASMCGR